MQKKVVIDFYKVLMPADAPCTFEGMIENFMREVTALSERHVKISGNYIRLHDFQKRFHVYTGSMIKLRMDDIPQKGGLSGVLDDLPLGDDEGLADQTFFLYSPKYKILLYQRTNSGVRVSSFLHYLEKVTSIGPIELSPVLETDAVRKLTRMNLIRKFQFKFASPTNPAILSAAGPSIGSAVEMMHEQGAGHIEIVLSVGRSRRGTLALQAVKNYALNLLKISKEDTDTVEKLIVTGKELEDETSEPLDLLRHRMREQFSVTLKDRKIPADECLNGMIQSYDKREPDLAEQFGNET